MLTEMNPDPSTFAKEGLFFAVGLVVMVWSFESIHWFNFMRANPEIGSISGGGLWVYYPVFMLGSLIAFIAVMSGLQRALESELD